MNHKVMSFTWAGQCLGNTGIVCESLTISTTSIWVEGVPLTVPGPEVVRHQTGEPLASGSLMVQAKPWVRHSDLGRTGGVLSWGGQVHPFRELILPGIYLAFQGNLGISETQPRQSLYPNPNTNYYLSTHTHVHCGNVRRQIWPRYQLGSPTWEDMGKLSRTSNSRACGSPDSSASYFCLLPLPHPSLPALCPRGLNFAGGTCTVPGLLASW